MTQGAMTTPAPTLQAQTLGTVSVQRDDMTPAELMSTWQCAGAASIMYKNRENRELTQPSNAMVLMR